MTAAILCLTGLAVLAFAGWLVWTALHPDAPDGE